MRMSMKHRYRRWRLKAPNSDEFITASGRQEGVREITRDVGDLGRMSSHCAQQSTADRIPHFNQMVISPLEQALNCKIK